MTQEGQVAQPKVSLWAELWEVSAWLILHPSLGWVQVRAGRGSSWGWRGSC